MRIVNDQVEMPTNLAINQVSTPVWLGHIPYFSIQLVFTGPIVGEFKLQASNDTGPNERANISDTDTLINWTDVQDSTQAISAAGSHLWSVSDAGYKWVRVVWTATSGTGVLTSARFNGKGI
jgi:hypothetical protein